MKLMEAACAGTMSLAFLSGCTNGEQEPDVTPCPIPGLETQNIDDPNCHPSEGPIETPNATPIPSLDVCGLFFELAEELNAENPNIPEIQENFNTLNSRASNNEEALNAAASLAGVISTGDKEIITIAADEIGQYIADNCV